MRTKKRSYIQGAYLGLNIPIEIIRSAEMRGLDAIATGGGCDYITRTLSDDKRHGPRMVLGAADDAGSPDTLTERANVTLYIDDDDWSDGGYISFNFDTTVEALDFMAGFETTVLDLPHMKNNPLSCRSCGKELGSNPMCGECCGYPPRLEKHQLSMVEVAKSVFGMIDTDQPNGITPEPAQGWSSIEGGSDARE